MKAIIAVNNLGFIGKDGSLPWVCMDDLSHFRIKTMNSTCLVGYNTSKTLPKLPGRIVIEDKKGQMVNSTRENMWCIGGKKTYEKYCHLFDELHISHIIDNTIGDTTFPNLSNLNKHCKIFNYYFTL